MVEHYLKSAFVFLSLLALTYAIPIVSTLYEISIIQGNEIVALIIENAKTSLLETSLPIIIIGFAFIVHTIKRT